MKKIVLLITLTLLSISASAQDKRAAISQSELMGLVSQYRSKPNFEVVKLGGIAMGAIKTAALAALALETDPEVKAARKIIKGVRKIAIVDYSSCSMSDRDKFNVELNKILRNTEPLMEMKDDGETTRIFGVVSESGDLLENFILCNP